MTLSFIDSRMFVYMPATLYPNSISGQAPGLQNLQCKGNIHLDAYPPSILESKYE